MFPVSGERACSISRTGPPEEAARDRAVLDFLGHALQHAVQAQVFLEHVERGQHGAVFHADEHLLAHLVVVRPAVVTKLDQLQSQVRGNESPVPCQMAVACAVRAFWLH